MRALALVTHLMGYNLPDQQTSLVGILFLDFSLVVDPLGKMMFSLVRLKFPHNKLASLMTYCPDRRLSGLLSGNLYASISYVNLSNVVFR